jgi:hypothetical protein
MPIAKETHAIYLTISTTSFFLRNLQQNIEISKWRDGMQCFYILYTLEFFDFPKVYPEKVTAW